MRNSPARQLLCVVAGIACACLVAAPAAFAAPAAQGKPASTAAGTAASFARTQEKIAAMLGQRLQPDPLPESMPSPFTLPPSTLPQNPTDAKIPAERLAPATDSELLLYYGANLRISGTVVSDNKVHLIINQTPYKEGDTLTIKTKDSSAKLRVIAIAPGELTLGLNEAVQVIRFKK